MNAELQKNNAIHLAFFFFFFFEIGVNRLLSAFEILQKRKLNFLSNFIVCTHVFLTNVSGKPL